MLIENSNQAHGIGPPRGQPFDPSGWCGANFFRVDGDIGPDFNGIIGRLRDLLQYSSTSPPITRPGCWACASGTLPTSFRCSSPPDPGAVSPHGCAALSCVADPDMMEVGNLRGMAGPGNNVRQSRHPPSCRHDMMFSTPQ